MKNQNCQSCKGKGHVLEAAAVMFIPIFGVIAAFLERNDRSGVTRKKCKSCNGTGKFPEYKK